MLEQYRKTEEDRTVDMLNEIVDFPAEYQKQIYNVKTTLALENEQLERGYIFDFR